MDSKQVSNAHARPKTLRRYSMLILVGIILLLVLGFWFNTRLQANRFISQVQTIVTEAGLNMDNIEIRGQQITLSGEIENQQTRAKLLNELQALPGIQTVVDGLSLQRTILPTLSMRAFGGSLSVQGTLPDEETVKQLVSLLTKRFANIENQLEADHNTIAPEWMGKFEKLTPELAALEPLTFSIDGQDINVSGIAADRIKRDSLSLALQTAFGDEYNIHYQVSLPAPVDSARLIFKRDGVDVVLQGVLPNQAMVDRIVAAARNKFPATKVQFELSLNSNVSEPGWIDQAVTIIESLSAADPAGLEINNTSVLLNGTVKSERLKSELETLAVNAFSGPAKIDNQLVVVAPTKPAEFVLRVQNGFATMTGVLPDKLSERDLLAVSDTVFGPDKVTNRLSAANDVAEPDWLPEAIEKIRALKNVKNMQLTGNQDGVNISDLTLFTAQELSDAQTQTTSDNVRIVEAAGLEGSSASTSADNTGAETLNTAAQAEPVTTDAETTASANVAANNSASSADIEQLRAGLADIDVGEIQFAPNSTDLTAGSKAILDSARILLSKYQTAIVEVSGHTDSQGSEKYNLKLSQQRADSVVRYLLDKGVQGSQLVGKGYGESNPVADNSTESGRAANRRIELVVLN